MALWLVHSRPSPNRNFSSGHERHFAQQRQLVMTRSSGHATARCRHAPKRKSGNVEALPPVYATKARGYRCVPARKKEASTMLKKGILLLAGCLSASALSQGSPDIINYFGGHRGFVMGDA